MCLPADGKTGNCRAIKFPASRRKLKAILFENYTQRQNIKPFLKVSKCKKSCRKNPAT
jgi:hypothetical protein